MAEARRLRSVPAPLLALVGILLLQTAWMLAVPPFRGLDEHEHAYKAAAVARGDWSASHEASPQGRGQFVRVPDDLVQAARPVCESLHYTTPDNCRGRSVGEGVTVVASNAAPYNPTYYILPGLAALPFSGAHALYAMRVTSAVLCAGLLLLALLALRRWATTPWPGIALLSLLTPTMLYTTSIAAPNGLEMAAATLVWCSLLGIPRTRPGARPDAVLVWLGSAGAVLLALTRGLGPLFLLLIAVSVALTVPGSRLVRLVRDRRMLLAAAVSAAATVLAAYWIRSSHILGSSPTEVNYPGSPWPGMPVQWVLWFFQSMAAFPARDELAPMPLYAVGFIGWWLLVALGVRFTSARERLALLLVVVATTVVAVAVTLSAYERLGTSWQGRYGYPYALGFFLICGAAIDRAVRGPWRTARWPALVAGGVLLTTLLIGQLHVLADQVAHSPLAGTAEWWQPSYAVLVLLDAAGVALLAWALGSTPRPVANLDR